MNNDNKTKFIENSCNYVTNINRMLKYIKLEVIVDFIYSDQLEITIVINKVMFSLNFQIIENYVKNIKHIIAERVEILQLL